MISRTAYLMLAGAALAGAALASAAATPAAAKCQRLAYSVNDYGKEGPTNDAKKLLDKYIADWTKGQGISTYTVGKKDVKCDLFLNFIVFDEHTCQASALVCWGDGGAPSPAASPPATKPPSAKKAQAPG
jgi:hypothetical protein